MGGEAILGSVERIFPPWHSHEERRTHSELARPHPPELGSGPQSILPLLGLSACAVSPLVSLSSGISAYGTSVTSCWVHPRMEEPLPYTQWCRKVWSSSSLSPVLGEGSVSRFYTALPGCYMPFPLACSSHNPLFFFNLTKGHSD